jgi:Flp pilus assembly protein TadG
VTAPMRARRRHGRHDRGGAAVESATTREAHPSGSSREDRGAAAVEFAVVVPLLLLIVFGIINFGILFSQQLTLNNGVREGDRRAVVSDPAAPRTCDGIIAGVKNQLAGLAMNSSNVQVKVTQNGWTNTQSCGTSFVTTSFGSTAANVPCVGSFDEATAGRSLVVEAQYVAPIPVAFPPFPRTLTLSSKAVFRCEFTS